ncbi:hypothetical protein [Methylobacterium durans]|uniref:Uncharacterized protein n=1 Tax=Methylobacterium durans TaxID=2202825 RepID=A0A2U8WB53_9HYPH|nr:hypothetical protein [Methylobacterium durans]AWN42522.1 hypothetical protein DK389_20980 [Methylobacterium durans]
MFSDVRSAIQQVDQEIEDLIEEQDRVLRATCSRLALLYLKKDRMEELLAKAEPEEAAIARPPARPKPVVAAKAGRSNPAPVPAPLGRAATVIIEALDREGAAGLSGTQLNEAVNKAGMSRDAAEKAKTRVKRLGLVRHDELARRWYPLAQSDRLKTE